MISGSAEIYTCIRWEEALVWLRYMQGARWRKTEMSVFYFTYLFVVFCAGTWEREEKVQNQRGSVMYAWWTLLLYIFTAIQIELYADITTEKWCFTWEISYHASVPPAQAFLSACLVSSRRTVTIHLYTHYTRPCTALFVFTCLIKTG